jgi:hypothetical protein
MTKIRQYKVPWSLFLTGVDPDLIPPRVQVPIFVLTSARGLERFKNIFEVFHLFNYPRKPTAGGQTFLVLCKQKINFVVLKIQTPKPNFEDNPETNLWEVLMMKKEPRLKNPMW